MLCPTWGFRAAKIAAKHGKSTMNWEETFESIYLEANHSQDPNCHGYNASKNATGPGGAKSCVAPAPLHQSVNASLPPDTIVQAWMHGSLDVVLGRSLAHFSALALYPHTRCAGCPAVCAC